MQFLHTFTLSSLFQVEKASDDVQKQFSTFLKDASNRVENLQQEFDEIEKLRVGLANYLVEDEKKFTLEDCFATFGKFACQVQQLPLEPGKGCV